MYFMAWTKEDRKAWIEQNPDYQKQWYLDRAEKLKKRARDHYKNNKAQHRRNQIKWNEKNQEKLKAYQRDWHRKRRMVCIETMGGKCKCCGEANEIFLAIDHVNNDGHIHRKEVKKRMIYGWLIKNNFPPGFQLLCHNCNMAKAIAGICPHQQKAVA